MILEHTPKTAEALMKARYSAFCVGDVDYIKKTSGKEALAQFLLQGGRLDSRIEWTGLEIVRTEKGGGDDLTGIVEFKAYYSLEGLSYVLWERSTFAKMAGSWVYVSGEHFES
jgi:SEC-C motif domain protein